MIIVLWPQLLGSTNEGYEEQLYSRKINANFGVKDWLIKLVQNKQFFGHDKQILMPTSDISTRSFYDEVPERPENWLEKEPPRSIQTWDDLVSKIINKFFPTSKTTNLQNEITRFQQRFDETFYEAWDRFNDLLRASTSGNVYKVINQDYVSQAAAANFNQEHRAYRAQISIEFDHRFSSRSKQSPCKIKGNNQNRYPKPRKFQQAPAYQPPVHQGQVYRLRVVQPPAYQAPAISSSSYIKVYSRRFP
ncbi:reverse transcriptase domain-containing protein [Tanacetum coccineum]|uniref:Reverse transcriptase domain-containing protein n=1 Tax=Tanacetum coccineum TaxID=301880 RepID=A0ABQ4XLI2_9ASTR